jgi:hypothetical protein
MNEQVDFYSKLFQSEGWDENSAHDLTRYIVNKLDNNDTETLDEDISLDDISKVIKILSCIILFASFMFRPFLVRMY